MNSGVYKITLLHTNEIYFGETQNFQNRFKQHLLLLRRRSHWIKEFQIAFDEYGESGLKFQPIVICDKPYRKLLEIKLIKINPNALNKEHNYSDLEWIKWNNWFDKPIQNKFVGMSRYRQ